MEDYEETLRKRFHISYLRPYQELIVRRTLENVGERERTASITALPTGSGKTICFMLPALIVEGYTVLLYPLKSLMNDQARRLDAIGEPYALFKGGMTKEQREEELLQLKKREKKIIITNMEMLLFLTASRSLEFLRGSIELFVMDEAHTIISWKDDFRKSYNELGRILSYLGPHQAMCFTATLSPEMKEELKAALFKDVPVTGMSLSPDRDNVFYHSVASVNKRADIERILSPASSRPAIVFCSYRRECEEWARIFEHRFPVNYYHSGLGSERRKELESWFYHSDNGIMFATNAYGTGIDVSGIRTIIHTRIPSDALEFLQESGRGGRDGEPYDSWVLHCPADHGGLEDIFRGSECIRARLLDGTDSGRGDTGCRACSVCVDDGYRPAGISEMLHFRRKLFFLPEKKVSSLLTHPLIYKKVLPGWSGPEVVRALRLLGKRWR